MKTPVAFIIFKRPDTTEKVFEAIRKVKPPKLLVIADGARLDQPGESEKCAATRAIIDRVDWDCEVLKNYSDVNLGCGKRVSSGLDWVFENVEEAIILEDDCLPDLTFFRFCEELLKHYRYDERIMSISALNVPNRIRLTSDSYFFSRYQRSWGWATWRRAWKYFDLGMHCWPLVKNNNWLEDVLENSNDAKDWTKIFESVYEEHVNIWDYQWMLACWLQSGLSILPSVNLVTNIGFGKDATHTHDTNEQRVNLKRQSMSFPLEHPQFIVRDSQTDTFIQTNIHRMTNVARLKNNVKQLKGRLGQYLNMQKLGSIK
ncbi:hypothetical protein [Pleurocapsa sp. PCC 7319]|uniref:hypothetical protein n=1 Tax=Pleurocapsa sp. PCC 7319 TaxID=118161 RepID=UPI00034A6E4F|nr:hypothetical protein [Pleurocapsa sp. PCC 7319]